MSQITTNQTTTNQEVTTAKTATKKPYHTPQLRKLGNVSELTHTSTTGSGSDGGSFPNFYTS
jgi:hypothetical protein